MLAVSSMWVPAEMKVSHMDPQKAKQAERLGMGLGRAKYEKKIVNLCTAVYC